MSNNLLHFLYRLFTPVSEPKHEVGDLVLMSDRLYFITNRRMQRVRYGNKWNEESRGYFYELDNIAWINESELKAVSRNKRTM